MEIKFAQIESKLSYNKNPIQKKEVKMQKHLSSEENKRTRKKDCIL